MIFNRIRNIQNPDKFQGARKNSIYFEGWYFKLVDREERHALIVIPGLAISAEGQKEVFIQVLNGSTSEVIYKNFDYQKFVADPNQFKVSIKDSEFSDRSLNLQLKELEGKIQFSDTQGVNRNVFSPGIMGWTAYVPYLNCYHGIVSMHHSLKGQLLINGKKVDFSGGTGYVEKNWGKSFPEAWIWVHSNHFDQDEVSFTFSMARLNWMGRKFTAFFVSFWLEGQFYKLSTYKGHQLKAMTGNAEGIQFQVKSKNLVFFVETKVGSFSELKFPSNGTMNGSVWHSLDSEIGVKLVGKDQTIFDGKARNTGFEWGGSYQQFFER